MICRQRRTHLNPEPSQVLKPAPQPQNKPATGEEKCHQTHGSCPGSFKDKKNDATATAWLTSCTQTSQDTRILPACHLPFLLHRRTHTSPHQEVSQQFQEALRSWIETSNNTETPGNKRDLHILAVSLAGWPNHQL